MDLVNDTPFPAIWWARRSKAITIAVQGTFDLATAAPAAVQKTPDPDVHFKPRTDVLVNPPGPVSIGSWSKPHATAAAAERPAAKGTFDESWLRNRWPWFPDDFDWSYFNLAPRDQQIETPRGDETVSAGGVSSKLPGLRIRCFVTEMVGAKEEFHEVPMTLDTVRIEGSSLALVWRGNRETENERLELYVVSERLDRPRTADVYRRRLDTRLYQRAASRHEATRIPEPSARAAALAIPETAMENVDEEILEVERDAAAFGETSAPPEPVRWREELREAHEELRERLVRAGVAVPDSLEAGDLDTELPAAVPVPMPPSREPVLEKLRRGESLEGADLSELDLAGADLSGARLSRAILSRAKLRGAKLEGADLRRASLAGADLSGVRAEGVRLGEADLGGAILGGADLSGADLTGADLSRTDLREAKLTKASAAGASFAEADLSRATLDGAVLDKADFGCSRLHRTSFRGASLRRAVFLQAWGRSISAAGADITSLRANQARLPEADFSGTRGPGSIWIESELPGADFSRSRLEEAEFSSAILPEARLGSANLREARLVGTSLRGSDLNRANLFGASLEDADLRGSDLRDSNLYGAGLSRARMEEARLDGANRKETR